MGVALLLPWSHTLVAETYGESGQAEEGLRLLAEVYGWFTEGFDTADLQEARTLLAALGG